MIVYYVMIIQKDSEYQRIQSVKPIEYINSLMLKLDNFCYSTQQVGSE